MSASQDADPQVPDLPAGFEVGGGRYRVEGKIDQGGMGIVYKAKDLKPILPQEKHINRAIKFILPSRSEPTLSEMRFVREIENVRSLRHPNIVEIKDYGETIMPNGLPGLFFVMELYEGKTLRAFLDDYRNSGKRVPREKVSTIITGIAEGLRHAHSRGIIHKDLKPANIIIEKLTADQIQPVILDFGLAHNFRDPEVIQDPSGTRFYMDNDAKKGAATAKSDIYALGLIAEELMA
jgi:serine/threonine protein kinase